jgi:aminoglycoside phosphotransferase (APT) family kinase protein
MMLLWDGGLAGGEAMNHEAEAAVVEALERLGLLERGDTPRFERLTGGVSSDIWRVDLARGPVCVKRALAKLRVAADWHAPIERNAYEAAWMRHAAAIVPDAVPHLLGQDSEAGVLVMAYLPAERYRGWKADLLAGRAEPEVAAAVGERLAKIHAGTAHEAAIAAAFPTDRIFHDIRLEPYLEATARAHPDRTAALHRLVDATAKTKLALVHGDVSPKNILVGPKGPVFLDAECAWYGDPAFDVAFCLNHLLLKCLAVPAAAADFLGCFDALAETYVGGITWEPAAALEARAAHLLPGLLLGRVDGKSPVEYLTAEADKERVRQVARRLLERPVERLGAVRTAWRQQLAGGSACA